MIRIISYFIVIGIFVVIINLLKYDNNFKRLTYESSFMEVISYVCCSFMGCGYLGIHPISTNAKILIIILSFFKFIIIIEVVMYVSTSSEYSNVYYSVKDIIKNAEKELILLNKLDSK